MKSSITHEFNKAEIEGVMLLGLQKKGIIGKNAEVASCEFTTHEDGELTATVTVEAEMKLSSKRVSNKVTLEEKSAPEDEEGSLEEGV